MSPKAKRTRTRARSSDRLTRTLAIVAVVIGLTAAALAFSLWRDRTATQAASPGAGMQPTRASSLAGAPSPLPMPVTPPPCEPPRDWITHRIQPGDTLYSLASQYNTDVQSLQRVNCLEGDVIVAGRDLHVPNPAGPTALPPAHPTAAAAAPVAFVDRYVNIVLLGSDKRKNDTTWRTDTIIVVSVDTERDVVRVLSVPRDLWVNIPGHGQNRINTADEMGELSKPGGGPDAVRQVIQDTLGIPVQYYVRADFQGFIKIIDAVGGVDVDVECPLTDIELTSGMHHMDGDMALMYARSRITTSDFDRGRRQRKILMALWAKGRNMNIIPRLPALWMAMRGTFETDIPLDTVLALAKVGVQLSPNRIFSQSIGPWQVENWTTPEGYQVLLPLPDEIRELLDSFYGPIDFEFLEKISATQVEVLNGSLRNQAAALASSQLARAGFQIARTDTADRQDYAQSQVIVYNSEPRIAELIAQQLDLPPSAIQDQPDPAQSVNIRVILGTDYDPCGTQ
jgi:LCP family protein required for cell wall assembly